MKAIVLNAPGGVDNFSYQDVSKPTPISRHVLIKVHACGVAHRDVIERKGGHPFMSFPIIQGHEFAGEVVELGDDCELWKVGDRVINLYTDSCGHCDACRENNERQCVNTTEAYGLTVNGGYAEYVAIHERALEKLIDGISYPTGATLMSAMGVGYNNVVNAAAVQAGDHVLITGASGGVGLAALQTAVVLGAKVWAVTSTESKRKLLLDYGASKVLVDDGQGFHKQLKKLRPQGVDKVIDCVGSPTLNASLRSLRAYGKVVVVGNVDSAPLRLNVGLLVVNAIQLLGSDNVTRKALREVMVWVRDGKIESKIDCFLPLAEVATAHSMIENREVFGRVVLQISTE